MSSAILFRAMVPFSPQGVPNLIGEEYFLGAREYDPIVLRDQTETLFRIFKKAQASIVLHWQKNSGHELVRDELSVAKGWLANIPLR